MAMSYNS